MQTKLLPYGLPETLTIKVRGFSLLDLLQAKMLMPDFVKTLGYERLDFEVIGE